ncbi:MAG: hypothetical protein WC749_12200 [Dehalococcoidia bacterium]
MAKVVAKLFKRPTDVNQAVKDLKAKGYNATIIASGANLNKDLADAGLPEQALEYYKLGLATGGQVVKVSVDDAKVGEVDKILLAAGFEDMVNKPPQYSTSPGFAKGDRMSATNPIDAKMSGDFRKY